MADNLNPSALGLSIGVVWGVALFLYGMGTAYYNYGGGLVSMLSSIYPGYSGTWTGAAIGALYGLVDGFIGAYIIAWLYNLFTAKKKGKR